MYLSWCADSFLAVCWYSTNNPWILSSMNDAYGERPFGDNHPQIHLWSISIHLYPSHITVSHIHLINLLWTLKKPRQFAPWGDGMWDWDPRIWDKRNWQGGNLLGEALMEVPKHQWKQVSMFDLPIRPVSNNFRIFHTELQKGCCTCCWCYTVLHPFWKA